MPWYAHEKHRSGRTTYWHLSPNECWTRLNDQTQPVVEVNVVEVPEGAAVEGDYWGWLRTGKEVPTMIYPALNLLRVCFPYDLPVAVKNGEGRVVRLRVTPVVADTTRSA